MRLLSALLVLFLCRCGGNLSPPSIPTVSAPAFATEPIITEVSQLTTKYKGRLVCVTLPQYPHCDIFLCGTLHVAKTSTEMVQDVIQSVRPQYVVLELCESRVDSLYEMDLLHEDLAANATLSSVISSSWQDKSLKTLGMGLLSWMQFKAAKVMGSKLGGELTMAAKEGAKLKSTIVLGDRLYGVTIQRVFDELKMLEKLKMCVLLFWEVVTMSVFRLKEYVRKTETDDEFIKEEIARFTKYLPTFANIIVGERDEYIAQTLLEIARVGFGDSSKIIAAFDAAAAAGRPAPALRGRIVAVCGAAHLAGVQRCLAAGGCSEARINTISSSSRHNTTWPGRGTLQIVNSQMLWGRDM